MADEDQQDQDQQDGAQDGQQDDAGQEIDYKAEYERVKREARKHEDRAKEGAAARKKLAEIEAAGQTAQEKAEAAAKAAEERAQAATLRIASAEVRAALTGIVPDPAAIVEDLNLAKYLTDDGEVDTDKVAALQAKYQALAPPGSRAPRPNAAQGSTTPALSLGQMIADAEKAGDQRQASRLKARQLVQQRNQQG